MNIIVTASSTSLDGRFDPRFGRCAYFVLVDTETLEWEAFPNPAIHASGGAGTRAGQFAAEKSAQAVISGNFGPNAASVLSAGGIPMYINKTDGTIRDVVQQFNAGELQKVDEPTARGMHHR